jgi:uncharacterized membrane protein YhaH (DUF805 family)
MREDDSELQRESQSGRDALLALHIAEYSALTTRCTYYIALHVGLWGVVVAVIAAALQQWSETHQPLTVWVALAAVQSLLQIWITLIEEQYLTVSYIESELRFSIANLASISPPYAFWRYEVFLGRSRRVESWWGEWLAPITVTVLLVLMLAWRQHEILSGPAEPTLLLVNLTLLAVLGVRTRQRIQWRVAFARRLDTSSGANTA